MLSNELCQMWGVTPAAMHKFLYNTRSARPKGLRQTPTTNRSWANVEQAVTCCGVGEIRGLIVDYKAFVEQLARIVLQRRYRCYVYYSVNRALDKWLKEAGFQQMPSFVNPNTNNTVVMWVLTIEQPATKKPTKGKTKNVD